ncbi:hypothetical protein BCON_0076g00010 [Botryotinia convoluta]|uniref:Uncharacterized protein n=1 Tax=Botryotinia convoluta TaxID=54673 RepID=A0A4Z1IIN0_9HELO|nr:hypothetical protein BCON_0076g00010 [Botryotinia convoluta]
MTESNRGPPFSQELLQSERSSHLTICQPGLLDTLHFTDDFKSTGSLKKGEVSIRVHSAGFVFRHALIALGEVPGTLDGSELSGIIADVGEDTDEFQVGERVCAVGSRSFSTLMRAHSSCVVKIPDTMRFAEEAAFPTAYINAYHCLTEVGHLKQGERVLIHAAAGSVGQAAVAIAQMVGAEIFATVGTVAKREHLINSYGIHQCLASYGRFIEIGKRVMFDNTGLEMAHFKRNVSFHFVDLGLIQQDKHGIVGQILNNIINLVGCGKLKKLSPITMYPVSEIVSAFGTLASGTVIGKIVIDFTGKSLLLLDALMISSVPTPRTSLQEEVEGRSSVHVQDLCAKLEKEGAQIHVFACDHSTFEDISHENFKAIVKPKVHRAWNIHNGLLNSKLDFFVSLSSVAGVLGNRQQSAYSATSTFLAAFTRYRRFLGLSASCITLGQLRGVGCVADNRQFREATKLILQSELSTIQFFAL